jgi:DNA-binding winged helix-turn-helix (wHTH) protein/predicted ATPase
MLYLFGDCTLDTRGYELRRSGTRVPLRPKVFQVLVYLLEQRDRVVTRDELLAQVWANQYVGDETLTSCVKVARRAVGDSGRAQRVIQTVHSRGLRFVAAVTAVDSPLAPPGALAPTLAVPPPVPPPLVVGREAELRTLHHWYTTARQGRRQVGFIAGEAGLGKTTLVETFVAQVATEPAVRIGHGQCIEQYGTGEAYLPVLEALSRLCRGPAGTGVLAWLRQQAPSWLGQLPAVGADPDRETRPRPGPETTPARMLRELAEALEVLTAAQPLVLIIEDLHWSDRATLEWLAYVARRRDPARLLVLATYRPTAARLGAPALYPITRDLLVHGQGAEVVLEGLSRPAVATYLTQRFGTAELATALGAVLYQRTQGNPLFLGTMVADLVQRGVLREGLAGWECTATLDTATVGVPETLRHLIEQQFERLTPTEQTLIEAASVAGVDFTAAAVAASIDMPAEDVDIRYATLARQGQFVQPHGAATWPDGTVTGRYRFGHALYHEVVYARVPPGRRVHLHRQIGWRLETGHGRQAPEIATELAEHFVRGHEIPQALHYLGHAVEHAAQRAAPHAVIDLVGRALALLATQPETPVRAQQELDLHMALGPAAIAAKGLAAPEVEQTYARARALCQQLGEIPQLFPALRGLWRFHVNRGALPTARALGERLCQLAQGEMTPALRLDAHTALGETLFFLGDYTGARTHLEQGIALTDSAEQPTLAPREGVASGVACLAVAAWTLWCLGAPAQAVRRSHEALALARADPQSQAFAQHCAAALHHRRRDVMAVQAHADALLTLATAKGFPLWVGFGTCWRGWALTMQGQGEVGLAEIHQGLAAVRATGQTLSQICLILLAEAAAHTGQVAQALRHLAEARTALEASRRGDLLAETYRLQGVLLLRQLVSDAPQTEACFQHALTLARRQQARAWELRAASSMARLWQQQGKRAEASALLAPVYGWFTEGFDTADLLEAQALLAELTGEPSAMLCSVLPSPYVGNGAHGNSALMRTRAAQAS